MGKDYRVVEVAQMQSVCFSTYLVCNRWADLKLMNVKAVAGVIVVLGLMVSKSLANTRGRQRRRMSVLESNYFHRIRKLPRGGTEERVPEDETGWGGSCSRHRSPTSFEN